MYAGRHASRETALALNAVPAIVVGNFTHIILGEISHDPLMQIWQITHQINQEIVLLPMPYSIPLYDYRVPSIPVFKSQMNDPSNVIYLVMGRQHVFFFFFLS